MLPKQKPSLHSGTADTEYNKGWQRETTLEVVGNKLAQEPNNHESQPCPSQCADSKSGN